MIVLGMLPKISTTSLLDQAIKPLTENFKASDQSLTIFICLVLLSLLWFDCLLFLVEQIWITVTPTSVNMVARASKDMDTTNAFVNSSLKAKSVKVSQQLSGRITAGKGKVCESKSVTGDYAPKENGT